MSDSDDDIEGLEQELLEMLENTPDGDFDWDSMPKYESEPLETEAPSIVDSFFQQKMPVSFEPVSFQFKQPKFSNNSESDGNSSLSVEVIDLDNWEAEMEARALKFQSAFDFPSLSTAESLNFETNDRFNEAKFGISEKHEDKEAVKTEVAVMNEVSDVEKRLNSILLQAQERTEDLKFKEEELEDDIGKEEEEFLILDNHDDIIVEENMIVNKADFSPVTQENIEITNETDTKGDKTAISRIINDKHDYNSSISDSVETFSSQNNGMSEILLQMERERNRLEEDLKKQREMQQQRLEKRRRLILEHQSASILQSWWLRIGLIKFLECRLTECLELQQMRIEDSTMKRILEVERREQERLESLQRQAEERKREQARILKEYRIAQKEGFQMEREDSLASQIRQIERERRRKEMGVRESEREKMELEEKMTKGYILMKRRIKKTNRLGMVAEERFRREFLHQEKNEIGRKCLEMKIEDKFSYRLRENHKRQIDRLRMNKEHRQSMVVNRVWREERRKQFEQWRREHIQMRHEEQLSHKMQENSLFDPMFRIGRQSRSQRVINIATIKLQSLWRGYKGRKRLLHPYYWDSLLSKMPVYGIERLKALVCGYVIRKRLNNVLHTNKDNNTSFDDNLDDLMFGDDLDNFNFDMSIPNDISTQNGFGNLKQGENEEYDAFMKEMENERLEKEKRESEQRQIEEIRERQKERRRRQEQQQLLESERQYHNLQQITSEEQNFRYPPGQNGTSNNSSDLSLDEQVRRAQQNWRQKSENEKQEHFQERPPSSSGTFRKRFPKSSSASQNNARSKSKSKRIKGGNLSNNDEETNHDSLKDDKDIQQWGTDDQKIAEKLRKRRQRLRRKENSKKLKALEADPTVRLARFKKRAAKSGAPVSPSKQESINHSNNNPHQPQYRTSMDNEHEYPCHNYGNIPDSPMSASALPTSHMYPSLGSSRRGSVGHIVSANSRVPVPPSHPSPSKLISHQPRRTHSGLMKEKSHSARPILERVTKSAGSSAKGEVPIQLSNRSINHQRAGTGDSTMFKARNNLMINEGEISSFRTAAPNQELNRRMGVVELSSTRSRSLKQIPTLMNNFMNDTTTNSGTDDGFFGISSQPLAPVRPVSRRQKNGQVLPPIRR